MKSLRVSILPIALCCAAALGQTRVNGVRPTTTPASRPTTNQYQSFAMTHLGDPDRGRALFFDQSTLACSRCHSVERDRPEPHVGPGLFAIGDKFGRRELIESILAPSATIAVGYSTTTVRTRSGEIVQGILRESSANGIALMQADGALARIPAADIVR
jgi:putative heme-binding domain-containing protein